MVKTNEQNIGASAGPSAIGANQVAPPGNHANGVSTGNGASPQHELIVVLDRMLIKVKGVHHENEKEK